MCPFENSAITDSFTPEKSHLYEPDSRSLFSSTCSLFGLLAEILNKTTTSCSSSSGVFGSEHLCGRRKAEPSEHSSDDSNNKLLKC